MPLNTAPCPSIKPSMPSEITEFPTATWTDIYNNTRPCFCHCWTMQEDILNDFRKSVDKVVADGISLQDFRKDFDSVVAKHGWG
ncbi:hypothetical protein CDW43_15005 [Methylophaga nitratireducenticrescens]|nr:hypothetical protein CDW43_15005 [Methylophaga nitratireducenticrescens]